ncbi:MAG: PqqD family protein [Gemmatimonadaceae bacterium]
MVGQFRRGDRHVHRLIAGEHLLINLRRAGSESFYSLSPSAAALWDALVDWTSVDALVEQLQRAYEVTEAEASADVEEFLAHLTELEAVDFRKAEL